MLLQLILLSTRSRPRIVAAHRWAAWRQNLWRGVLLASTFGVGRGCFGELAALSFLGLREAEALGQQNKRDAPNAGLV